MAHYFEERPEVRSRRHEVPLVLPDRSLTLMTDRGVFSADRVDPGTRLLLLEAPPPPPTGDLLDVGCGYGPIAVVVALRAPEATVWAVDVNERARALTAENAERAGAGNVRVCAPGDVPGGLRFAAVYSNPPIRIGKAALHELLVGWLGRLQPAGRAWLVVQRHLGADSLARWLAERGADVQRRRSRAGYRLLEVGPLPGGGPGGEGSLR